MSGLLVLTACASPSATPSSSLSSSPSISPDSSGSVTPPPTGGAASPAPLNEVDSVTSIDAAERAGTIDHDTALVYKLYAALDYASLPVEFQSSDPATPEATGILAELSGRLDALSAELRAKVAPYFLRPDDPDSFWQKGPATTATAPGSIRLAGISLAAYVISLIDYKYVDVAHAPIRVWYPVCSALVPVADCHDPIDGPPYAERAQQLANEIDRSTMWDKEKTAMLGHEPCTDATSSTNGGDGRLDIYLVIPFVGLDWGGRAGTLDSSTYGKTLAGAAVPETAGQSGCPTASHIILDANRPFDRLKFTTAHELFHAFQFSFKNAGLGDRDWWAEASATWASDLVYRDLNYEQEYLKGYWSMAGQFPEGPLDNTAGLAEYGAYLWPFYLVQKSGDASGTAVGRLWQASETVSPIQAMGQLPGWTDGFKDFALWNWNKNPALKYVDAAAPIAPSKLSQATSCMGSSGTGDCTLKIGDATIEVDQGPTTVQYYEGVPDEAVEFVRFDLTGLKGKPGLGIQAILSIGGDEGTKVEDWTGLDERAFCVKSDDLRKIVLVVSNSSLDSDLTGKINVEGLPIACTLSGTSTWTDDSHYDRTRGDPPDHNWLYDTWHVSVSGLTLQLDPNSVDGTIASYIVTSATMTVSGTHGGGHEFNGGEYTNCDSVGGPNTVTLTNADAPDGSGPKLRGEVSVNLEAFTLPDGRNSPVGAYYGGAAADVQVTWTGSCYSGTIEIPSLSLFEVRSAALDLVFGITTPIFVLGEDGVMNGTGTYHQDIDGGSDDVGSSWNFVVVP